MPLNVDVMVFDSGVGGLSVLEAIRKHAPHLSYCFVGDSAGLPYGDKSDAWLVDRVPRVIAGALEKVQCQLLVVACNTASTIVLPPLRSQFSFPVIGVVPAIKPAAALSSSKIIGLLATPATIKRPYTDALIEEFARDCRVIKVGSSRLVAIAEEKMRGHPVSRDELMNILKPFADSNPDVVVLGCTHFPLLHQEIAELLPSIRWIDSGAAVAKRVLHYQLEPAIDALQGASFFTQDDLVLSDISSFGLTSLEILTV
ncbi:MAG: glutamate racemase [Chitinophagaceae bacterium]|nr:glutamate racemase [Oligoflexus sp.]